MIDLDYTERRLKLGYFLFQTSYLLASLALLIVYKIVTDASLLKCLGFACLTLVTSYILYRLESAPLWVYGIFQNFFFFMVFINSYYLLNFRALSYLEVLLLTVINFYFLSPTLIYVQLIVQSLGQIFLYIGLFNFSNDHLSLPGLITVLLVYTIVAFIGHLLCVTITMERKIAFEHEQSLDDLLRVVEAKVDDARDASRSKADFLSNMSHEIRTPINSILGMNTLIMRESSNPDILRYAGNINASGKLLLSLINDILDFSKIEHGNMEIVPVSYELSSMLNDVAMLIYPLIIKKHLKFVTKINPLIPEYLSGDDVRIKQVLVNLLNNAVKYTDEGSVTLSMDYIRISYGTILLNISVTDTGRGIKPEDLDKLFNAFQRADEKKNRNIQGTGLGLSIADNLVRLMGGKINVESEYGMGTTFSFAIIQTDLFDTPIGEYRPKLNTSSEPAGEKYKESFKAPNAKIMIVDDNELNIKVVKGLLKKTSLRIESVMSGRECIELLERTSAEDPFDLVFLDHMMPDMDGIETLEEIKKKNLFPSMPIVALTANALAGSREMFLSKGFTDYLSKPIEAKDLEKMLQKYLPPDKLMKSE